MKLKLPFFLFLMPAVAVAQTRDPLWTPTYTCTSDTIKVVDLNMLGRVAPKLIDDGATLPSRYNWTNDLRMGESIKRMSLDTRRLDANGREMPVDVFQYVRNEAFF